MAKNKIAFNDTLQRYQADLELLVYHSGVRNTAIRVCDTRFRGPQHIQEVRDILYRDILKVKRSLVANDIVDKLLQRGIVCDQGYGFALATPIRSTDWIRSKNSSIRAETVRNYDAMSVLLNSGAVISNTGCFVGYCDRYTGIEITPRYVRGEDDGILVDVRYNCDFHGRSFVYECVLKGDMTAAREHRCFIRRVDVLEALAAEQSLYWTPGMSVEIHEASPFETGYFLSELERESEHEHKHQSEKAA